jgi:hypothetical protein
LQESWLFTSGVTRFTGFKHVIKLAIGAKNQFIHDPHQRKIDRYEFNIGHCQGCFPGSHHNTQIAHASLNHIGCHLQGAYGLEVLIKRLNNQQFNPFEPGIFKGTNGCAVDATEKHGLMRPDVVQHPGDDRFQQGGVDLVAKFCPDGYPNALSQGIIFIQRRFRCLVLAGG